MAIHESNVFTRCQKLLGTMRCRLFRNNVGAGYLGRTIELKPGQMYRAKGGERVILGARFVEFGLFKGSGDGIGWAPVVVTPDMVGKTVAVFLSVETKAGKGAATEEQQTWRDNVRRAGGIAIITNDHEQAAREVQEWRP